MERFWLTPDDEQAEAERDWTLRSSDGQVLATVEAPVVGTLYARPLNSGTYRVEAYGPGWRLATRATYDDRVLLWFTGRWVRSGGRLLVASNRSYDVRSRLLQRLDLNVREADGSRLIEARVVPRPHLGADIVVTVLRPPRHAEDTDLLVTFVGALELLVFRHGRSFSDLRAPA